MQRVIKEGVQRHCLLGPGKICDVIDVAIHVNVGAPRHLLGPLNLNGHTRTCVMETISLIYRPQNEICWLAHRPSVAHAIL